MSHDEATHQAYRWGEDGLLGITDDQCNLCLSLALWNENDPILKERLYGLTNRQVSVSITRITDDQCYLCLSLVLWNGNGPILKERLYGLTHPQVSASITRDYR